MILRQGNMKWTLHLQQQFSLIHHYNGPLLPHFHSVANHHVRVVDGVGLPVAKFSCDEVQHAVVAHGDTLQTVVHGNCSANSGGPCLQQSRSVSDHCSMELACNVCLLH